MDKVRAGAVGDVREADNASGEGPGAVSCLEWGRQRSRKRKQDRPGNRAPSPGQGCEGIAQDIKGVKAADRDPRALGACPCNQSWVMAPPCLLPHMGSCGATGRLWSGPGPSGDGGKQRGPR